MTSDSGFRTKDKRPGATPTISSSSSSSSKLTTPAAHYVWSVPGTAASEEGKGDTSTAPPTPTPPALGAASTPAPPTPLTPSGSTSESTPASTPASGSTPSTPPPADKAKLSAIARLKLFSGTLGLPLSLPSLPLSGKSKAQNPTLDKDVGKGKEKERPRKIVFPPPSWNLDDEEMEGWKEREGRSRVALLEGNYEGNYEGESLGKGKEGEKDEGKDEEEEENEETVSFAKRLKGMLDVLLQSRLQLQGAEPSVTSVATEAEPIPEGMDQELMRMLSSEEVMNGTLEQNQHKGKTQTPTGAQAQGETHTHVPVWNVLAGLRSKLTGKSDSTATASVESDQEGIMLYGPLSPAEASDKDSQVSLGSTSPSPPTSSTSPSSQEERTWVPSTVQLSILTTWWGYRLYLPPPVMASLDSSSLKATTRAALLATSIKWIIDKIPMKLVPVQLRPAVTLLKGLSPVVNYIGVFVAWSWDRVRSLDRGNGVVLTATWLLPVALVPMTWDAGDIYGPVGPPKDWDPVAAAKAAEAEEAAAAAAAKTKAEGKAGEGEDKNTPPKTKKPKSYFRW